MMPSKEGGDKKLRGFLIRSQRLEGLYEEEFKEKGKADRLRD